MKKNMGLADRLIRAAVAILVVVLYLTKQISGITEIVLLIFAAVFLLTGLVSVCPLYLPFGLSTLRRQKKAE